MFRLQPGFAFALAVGPAEGAQAGFGGVAAVDGTQGIVVFGKSHHGGASFVAAVDR